MRLLLIGSGAFALPSFAALAAADGISIVGVVTAAPRPAGRNGALRATPVAAWAATNGLPLIEVARIRDAAWVQRITALDAQVGLLADFGQIVPAALLSAPRHGILNLHPSLLPRHRGASPVPATILAGESETGVCTMLMDEGLDTGPILDVVSLPLHGDEIASDLEERLASLAAARIVATVHAWVAGEITPRPQASEGASTAPRLRRGDGRIGQGTSVTTAWRAWRAYQPWPGVFVEIPGIVDRLRIDAAAPPLAVGEREPAKGSFSVEAGLLLLHLAGGALPLVRVTPSGGREMEGGAFLRGHPELLATHARIAP